MLLINPLLLLLLSIRNYRCRFRCCSCCRQRLLMELLSSIADANALAVAADHSAADCSTAVVAALSIRNYVMNERAIDQFFAVNPSNTKRIGVPPLLRTESATLCLWDRP